MIKILTLLRTYLDLISIKYYLTTTLYIAVIFTYLLFIYPVRLTGQRSLLSKPCISNTSRAEISPSFLQPAVVPRCSHPADNLDDISPNRSHLPKSLPKATLNEAGFATLWISGGSRRKLTGAAACWQPKWLCI